MIILYCCVVIGKTDWLVINDQVLIKFMTLMPVMQAKKQLKQTKY